MEGRKGGGGEIKERRGKKSTGKEGRKDIRVLAAGRRPPF